jgi:diguanylate cyclase (GGDEF)-like protein/PAS domain S-box-containing protein
VPPAELAAEDPCRDCAGPPSEFLPLSVYDRLVALATRLAGVPIAILSLADEDAGTLDIAAVAAPDLDEAGVTTLREPRRLLNPAVAGEFFAFHASVPLTTPDGRVLGSLLVLDRRTRTLSEREAAALRDVAGLATECVLARGSLGRLARADAALRALTAGLAARTGDEFFRALVTELTRTLGVAYAFVAETAGAPADRARVVALCADGRLVDGVEYPLAGTPCRDVLADRLCVVPRDARARYPDDPLLVQAEVESYVGVQLCCGEGDRLGWLAVMDRRPLTDLALTESVLRMFAARASAELERRRVEAALRRSQGELEHRVAERTSALHVEKEKFSKAFRSSPDPMAIVAAADGRFLEVNDALLEQSGYARGEMLGRTALDLRLWVEPEERARLLRALDAEGAVRGFEFEYRRRTGERRMALLSAERIDIHGETCILAVVHDVTAAFRDELTGLPNRAVFLDRLERAVERGRRHPTARFAVLFLDLDRFKMINDGLGHAAGDRLLVAIAAQLGECVRPEDTVARMGGDEFTILLDEITDVGDATRVAERIQQALALPLTLDGQEVFTSASVGIALHAPGVRRAEDLLRDADTAMYRAKARGRAGYQVFDTAMHEHAVAQLRLETDLRQAVERREFVLHYQPIVALESGAIIGFEALVRWRHPTRGLLVPGDFLQVAEDTGLIVPIGRWVLAEACRQTRRWQDHFPETPPWTVSVNISGRLFNQAGLLDDIHAVLGETGIDPRTLMLEITESVLMDGSDAVRLVLDQLRALHIRLSIDDFGTGYSSLSYLHRFPIDILKIDRSFVGGMQATGENLEIVRSIVSMAHSLAKDVIAEGVETAEQLAQLRALDCDYVQGHFFSRTVDPETAAGLLARGPRWAA